MVHVWSINSGERFQGHHGPLVKLEAVVDDLNVAGLTIKIYNKETNEQMQSGNY